jgi:hypothetical protein
MKNAFLKFVFFMAKFVTAFLLFSFIFGKIGLLIAILFAPAFLGFFFISAMKIAAINLFTIVSSTIGAYFVSEKIGKVVE